MDESTHGEGSLRSVNKSSHNKPSSLSPLATNPRIEKRRRIHLKQRNKQFIQLWRTFIFSSITYGLGVLVINNGWGSIDVAQMHVKGSSRINTNTILFNSGVEFPRPLFTINPKQLEINLLNSLPVKNVQIRRRLIPPSLEIEVTERKPIVFADRRGPKGKEEGMLDKNGYWMPITMANLIEAPEKDVYVEGWMDKHRNWVSIILENKKELGSPLKRIIVSPNGEMSLTTEDFDLIRLGSNSFNFREQIKALNQLSKNLPVGFVNQTGSILDIKDPSKPELQLPQN